MYNISLGVDNATVRALKGDCHGYSHLHNHVQRFKNAVHFSLQHGRHIVQRHERVILLPANALQTIEIIYRQIGLSGQQFEHDREHGVGRVLFVRKRRKNSQLTKLIDLIISQTNKRVNARLKETVLGRIGDHSEPIATILE